jgi:phosphoglucosamine mutase
MDKLFGTDGIRAVAGHYPLDYSSVYTLGSSLIALLRDEGLATRVLIGRDTRESGEWLELALAQGIRDAGGDAVSVGLIPTSAVSYLTKKHHFSGGIVLSASHNPYQDNGIKIFSSEGMKISEEWENILEKAINNSEISVTEEDVDITQDISLTEEYSDFLKGRLNRIREPGKTKIVLDCSNGASTYIAPRVFEDLGFEVTTIGTSPNGKNINEGCGSLHPEQLAETVVGRGADIGIAYDGDADRALWVDEKGTILNGDHTLYVLANFMKERDLLISDTVVATTMSNMGLEKAFEKLGLKLYRTQVGDKYVLEQMIRLKSNLGGEQSGHTIFLDDCPTGDGILTSIKMVEAMVTQEESLSELIQGFDEFPQILKNVPVSRKDDFGKFPEIMEIIMKTEQRLGESGRLNVRYSGTEPLARIMIEGESQNQIEDYADQIAAILTRHLG